MSGEESVPFPYMRWAKKNLTGYGALNLGMSGIAGLTTAHIPLDAGLEYWAPEGEYGDPRLRESLAAREGVSPAEVFVSAGSSLANFLVYLAEAQGAHVAVETPGYEALLALPKTVGATFSTFHRVEAQGWRIDPASLRASLRPSTRLIVVTDLHNPTGARLHPADLDLLVAEAERVGATVLVDEVYRELDLVRRPTAARARPRVLVTNSLTKSHGLGGLRVGWILGAPEKIEKIACLNDLVCPAHPVPSLAVAKAYLGKSEPFLERTLADLRARLAQADAWVRARADVSWQTPHGGISGFLRLPQGVDADRFAERAFSSHGVRVIPGSFFQSRDHVRISYGLPAADLARALDALGAALDESARSRAESRRPAPRT